MAPAWQEIIRRAAQRCACSHVSGLLMQSGWTAGPWGPRTEASSFERDRCPDEASGLARLRRIDRLCHHASLLSRKLQNVAQRPKPLRPPAGSSPAGASPPKRCVPSCWPAPPPPPGSAAGGAVRSPTDRHWSPSSVADWRGAVDQKRGQILGAALGYPAQVMFAAGGTAVDENRASGRDLAPDFEAAPL